LFLLQQKVMTTKRNIKMISGLGIFLFFFSFLNKLPVDAQITCNTPNLALDQFLFTPVYLLRGTMRIDLLNLIFINPNSNVNNSYCQITWMTNSKLYQAYYQSFANSTAFRYYVTENGRPYFYRGTQKSLVSAYAVFDGLNLNKCVLQNTTLVYQPSYAEFEIPTTINPAFTVDVTPPTNCKCRNFDTSFTVFAYGMNSTINNFIAQTGTDCVFEGFI